MTEQDFIPKGYSKTVESGTVGWESPSNIALIKYWGKRDPQIPENPSVSFTLTHCKTITSLAFKKRDAAATGFSFEVYLDDEKKEDFKPKINTFFERVEPYLAFLKDYEFVINTQNTFPHSSGIASSASGMSALALCLMSIEKLLWPDMSDLFFNQKASFLARLGSGSACRSIEGDLVVWGKHSHIEGSSDLYGVKYPYEVHGNFENYQDTILLVDRGEKQVSSTLGHHLMHGHPFAKQRFEQARTSLIGLKGILKTGDLPAFMALVESEALALHAMMMTSEPYFILMKPNTLEIINRIWAFRKETDIPVCFTLDAGANVHVLYPESVADKVLPFIKQELARFCQNGQFICDVAGFGARALKTDENKRR